MCLKKKEISWPTELSIFINIELVKNKLVLQTVFLFSWYACEGFLNVSWSSFLSEEVGSLFQLKNLPYWKWEVNYYNYLWLVNLYNLNCIHSLWKAEADICNTLIDWQGIRNVRIATDKMLLQLQSWGVLSQINILENKWLFISLVRKGIASLLPLHAVLKDLPSTLRKKWEFNSRSCYLINGVFRTVKK